MFLKKIIQNKRVCKYEIRKLLFSAVFLSFLVPYSVRAEGRGSAEPGILMQQEPQGEGGNAQENEGNTRDEGGNAQENDGNTRDEGGNAPIPVKPGFWKNEDGKWYYIKDGEMLTGWQDIGEHRFFFHKAGDAKTGWLNIDDKWYYFSKRGIMQTGWKKIGTGKYYFQTDGVRVTGWNKLKDKWYLFNDKGTMQTGWKQWKGSWYYLAPSGVMKTGWLKKNSTWYYLCGDGRMAVGWKQVSGKWYYFVGDGRMTVGWQKVKDKWYYLDKSGEMLKDRWIGDYYLGKDGSWLKKLPASVRLKVKNILQRPELPMGCEVTSLDIVLQYHGFDISKEQLSDKYLPKGSVDGTSPNEAFIGNPRSYGGWYCYSAPIVECANAYLQSTGAKQSAVNLTGTKFEDLFYELVSGRPVVIWGTLSMGSPSTRGSWYAGGRSYPRYINLHCLVMTGYDKKKGLVYIADPRVGNRAFSISRVKRVYEQMGSQAVVIRDTD